MALARDLRRIRERLWTPSRLYHMQPQTPEHVTTCPRSFAAQRSVRPVSASVHSVPTVQLDLHLGSPSQGQGCKNGVLISCRLSVKTPKAPQLTNNAPRATFSQCRRGRFALRYCNGGDYG